MKKCPICKSFRSLDDHLFELSEYCRFLDNEVPYKKVTAKTETIAKWLRLSAELEDVKINKWAFDDGIGSAFCKPIADALDSHSKHLGTYSTNLTKFLYLSFALEESYRFFEHFCRDSDVRQKFFSSNLRVAWLMDNSVKQLPINMDHAVQNLRNHMKNYRKDFEKLMSIRDVDISPEDKSYALHLVRCLRNWVAHGVFPIAENPEYGDEIQNYQCINLLRWGCRVGALCIQMLLYRFVDDFRLLEFESLIVADEENCTTYFSDWCTKELVLTLHQSIEFSFVNPLGNEL